ncbi:DNA repair protein RecN [Ornithinimicrobium humiphilum]|uniref:DNA repair protein RecN n=1 Tax=Ornithinimicrobium humiphilum TaxID=125288 RepID=A0A543KPQ5_9MICO|nr:DNA repair protein RecN [Ornithinimicrobium humiphilum]TQM97051.1 DNA replication and repair protein RecN [Ornithinimicrobium humiphilum]
MTLRRIRIQGLGVIDDAELELSDGLNVITGETGAGKTMVVSGLGLLLGARADAGMVRAGTPQAVVEGEVDVPATHPAAVRAEEAGGDATDGLLLVRSVAAGGRSRAHVGGRAAPVAVLAEIGEHLVAVHGQADQWRLRDADQHRLLLDTAGGSEVAEARGAYERAYEAWRASVARLQELTRTAAERAVRVGMLRGALEEIEAVDAEEGEEDRLRAESERLTHAEELRSAALLAHDALVGSDDPGPDQPSVTALLATAGAALGPAAAHDEELAALRGRLDELAYLGSDLAADLASYGTAVEVDEERLAEVHQRRADLTAVLRKYGGSTTEMLALARRFADELAEIDVSDDDLAELRRSTEALRQEVARTGAALTAARTATAERVGAAVTRELSHLAMGSAEVSVRVEPRWVSGDAEDGDGGAAATVVLEDGRSVRPRPHGLDEVEIRLAANPGAPARSVTRAASGGELSRVMLALELVCGDGTVPTYVFDEVDAGVGGSAALDLGARLATLARTAQVLVVTHLAQVAAYADRHLVVRKSTDGQVTSSGVVAVEGAEREAELARMLGGVADSDAALEHARELLSRRATMAG